MTELSSYIKLIKYERYAVLKFNRPERLNAVKRIMYDTFSYYVDAVDKDNDIDLLVITGEGEYFTSGADMYNRGAPEPDEEFVDFIKRQTQYFKNFVISLINFSKPLIAAVNGPAVGVGVTLLPHCDVVYASDNSTFLTPFSRIGLCPEACSSYTFPKIMGYSMASDMLLFNRQVTALEAYKCGLVADVFSKATFHEEVDKRIKEFLDNPIKCLIHGKELIRGPERAILLEVNTNELDRLSERFMSPDPAQQALKFVQRRKDINKKRAKL